MSTPNKQLWIIDTIGTLALDW